MRTCGWHPVKALYLQQVMDTSFWGVSSGMATVKASTPQVPWVVLCLWLQKGVVENMAWSKPIDFYVLSRGSFRKLACNLAETAQRKSQSIPRCGGLRGAGGTSTDARIVANIERGFCPKKRSAAVVPSARVRKKLWIAVRHARFLGWSRPRS